MYNKKYAYLLKIAAQNVPNSGFLCDVVFSYSELYKPEMQKVFLATAHLAYINLYLL